MANQWFRIYQSVLDDPKVQRLSGDHFKGWVNLLCLACRNDGVLPKIDDIAFSLRLSEEAVETLLNELIHRKLLDRADDSLIPHNWEGRQFSSDSDSTAAIRKRRQRERERSPDVTVDVTDESRVTERDSHAPSHANVTRTEQNRTDTEQIQNRTEVRQEGALTALVADATPDCPHNEIVSLYHQFCPALPRVRDWTDIRQKALRQRWRESRERQRIEFWHDFFGKVSRSPFLCGVNDRSWTADIDWLLKPANFQKVIEGKYEVRAVERFSKTTQANIRAGLEFINGAA